MKEKWEVWLVDDLPSNLKKFKSNHKDHYKISNLRASTSSYEANRQGQMP